LFLIFYIWFVFLPVFEYTLEYRLIKNIALVITALLSISAGIQLFLSITGKDRKEV